MRRRRVPLKRAVGLPGLVLITMTTAQAQGIIGDDSRRTADAGAADLLSAVGIIACYRRDETRPRPARATATVVGNRSTVLTAAHLFVSDDLSGPRRLEYDAQAHCSFRQYDAEGDLLVEVGFSQAAYGAFTRNAGLPNQDWAVLKTSEPLPASTRPLAFAALAFDDLDARRSLPIAVVAYHADLRQRRRVPLLSEGSLFTVDYAGFRRLAHTADMGRMSSGAAIVHRTAAGVGLVVGVHRSAARFGDYNLAVPLSLELEEALRSFAYGVAPAAGQRMALVPARIKESCCSMVDAGSLAE